MKELKLLNSVYKKDYIGKILEHDTKTASYIVGQTENVIEVGDQVTGLVMDI